MVLYSELKDDYKIVSTVMKTQGKVDGVMVNTKDWKVSGLMIKPGWLKKNVLIKMDQIDSVDVLEKTITVSAEVDKEEVPVDAKADKKNVPLVSNELNANVDDVLIGKMAISSDGQEIGKIYDFDTPMKLDKWLVWKVLVKTGFKSRRIRVSSSDITGIGETVTLKQTKKEMEHQSKKESEEE